MKDQYQKASFSQSGEDLIVDFLFGAIGMVNPTYIDIGAYHPYEYSNTALLYSKGSRGLNIEPNPENFKLFLTERPEDINLNIGIGIKPTLLDYYQMDAPTLNTFSKDEAESFVKDHGHKIFKTTKIKVNNLDNVINEYLKGKFPDFMSLDIEALDMLILKSIDFDESYPVIICVETISYSNSGSGLKNKVLIEFLENKGYMVYGDTYINTIFIKKEIWIK